MILLVIVTLIVTVIVIVTVIDEGFQPHHPPFELTGLFRGPLLGSSYGSVLVWVEILLTQKSTLPKV